VEFVTASEAVKLYRDRARGRRFGAADLKAVAAAVGGEVTWQRHGDVTLSPAEVLSLLVEDVAQRGGGGPAGEPQLTTPPLGPTGIVPPLRAPVATDWSQFYRTTLDVADFLKKQGRVPAVVWLGSTPVPPEAYLVALARVALQLHAGPRPERDEIKPVTFGAAKYVSDDRPGLWGWVIFPPGFHAPELMELARRQAWTIKPAVLSGRE
jgi:hypothetical protein